jgi:hypothetical protein
VEAVQVKNGQSANVTGRSFFKEIFMERRVGSPARYRFDDRFLFIIVPLFLLDAVLGGWAFHYRHFHPTGILVYVCAALQSMPIIAFIVVLGLYLAEETDEFMRALWVQSLLWGTGATLAVTTFCGAMEKYGQATHMGGGMIPFVFYIAMIASLAVNTWRNR